VQSVNLYHGVLLPKPEKFPSWYLAVVLLLGVVGSAVWMFSSWQKHNDVQIQADSLKHTESQIAHTISLMKEQIPTAEQEAQLRAVILRLQKQYQDSQAITELVNYLESHAAADFSGILEDFSTLTDDDFWFTRIQVNQNGLELSGKTYHSAKIAKMVSQLQLLPHTKQAKFGQLTIERDGAGATAVNNSAASFHLSPLQFEVNHDNQ